MNIFLMFHYYKGHNQFNLDLTYLFYHLWIFNHIHLTIFFSYFFPQNFISNQKRKKENKKRVFTVILLFAKTNNLSSKHRSKWTQQGKERRTKKKEKNVNTSKTLLGYAKPEPLMLTLLVNYKSHKPLFDSSWGRRSLGILDLLRFLEENNRGSRNPWKREGKEEGI